MIAALFVHTGGAYYGLPNVDPWDEKRDARLYDGPFSVIAHPPCQRWGKLAYQVQAMYGLKIGDDDGCFESALRSVRRYGGILEHPRGSIAFPRFCIKTPSEGWRLIKHNGIDAFICEVYQSAYGHKAQKRTWLYCVSNSKPVDLRSGKPRGTHQIGGSKADHRPFCTKLEKISTPIEFRDELISIAENARK